MCARSTLPNLPLSEQRQALPPLRGVPTCPPAEPLFAPSNSFSSRVAYTHRLGPPARLLSSLAGWFGGTMRPLLPLDHAMQASTSCSPLASAPRQAHRSLQPTHRGRGGRRAGGACTSSVQGRPPSQLLCRSAAVEVTHDVALAKFPSLDTAMFATDKKRFTEEHRVRGAEVQPDQRANIVTVANLLQAGAGAEGGREAHTCAHPPCTFGQRRRCHCCACAGNGMAATAGLLLPRARPPPMRACTARRCVRATNTNNRQGRHDKPMVPPHHLLFRRRSRATMLSACGAAPTRALPTCPA